MATFSSPMGLNTPLRIHLVSTTLVKIRIRKIAMNMSTSSFLEIREFTLVTTKALPLLPSGKGKSNCFTNLSISS